MTMNNDENFSVKELAPLLGVSVRYVYEMRRCGFEMHGIKRVNRVSTVSEAVSWIEAHDFRMVGGVGRVQESAKPRDCKREEPGGKFG